MLSTVVPPVGGTSPHFGQKVAVEVIVVVEIVCVIDVIVPDVIVTGQVVTVVTTISVVTISELAGGVVIVGCVVDAGGVVFGTQTPPDDVSFSLQGGFGETSVVKGTQVPEEFVIDVPQVEVAVVEPPVGVFGEHVPLSGTSSFPQVKVVVACVVEGTLALVVEETTVVEVFFVLQDPK